MKNLFLTILVLHFLSCTGSSDKPEYANIDFYNKVAVDSLVKNTTQSNDTIFLGVVMGMTEKEYKNHMSELIEERIGLEYMKDKESPFGEMIHRDDTYLLRTDIFLEEKQLKGRGVYLLYPDFNKEDRLRSLTVLSKEYYEDQQYHNNSAWLLENIKKKSKSFGEVGLQGLEDYLVNETYWDWDDIQLRIKGNVVTHKRMTIRSEDWIVYQDLRNIFSFVLWDIEYREKEGIKDIRKEKKPIKF